jgi:hypothetical protein
MHKCVAIILSSVVLVGAISSVGLIALDQTEPQYVFNGRERALALYRCVGPYKDEEIDQRVANTIVEEHRKWLLDHPEPKEIGNQELADTRRANFCGSKLARDLDLSNTDLRFADFNASDLSHVKFSGAKLWEVDFSYANVLYADFSGASFYQTNFEGVDLLGSKFDHATLFITSFRNAKLVEVSMTEADVIGSDFDGAVFELEPGSLPRATSLLSVNGLDTLHFHSSVHALRELREMYKRMGAQAEERMVTYVIKSGENSRSTELERVINFLAFDLTTKWGMHPSRALLILLALTVVFAPFYVISLRLGGKNGISQISPGSSNADVPPPSPMQLGWTKAIAFGCYFSLLAAFRVGWREFNVGDWITRLQQQEYSLVATGWTRTVSGIQSLISLYLVAIWALTYFGRPFE